MACLPEPEVIPEAETFDITTEDQTNPSHIKSCDEGYHLLNNTCEKNKLCQQSEVQNQDCTRDIPYALKASVINKCAPDGQNYVAGVCTLDSCVSGYGQDGNSCQKEEVIVDISSVKGNSQPIIVHSKNTKPKLEKTTAA